MAAEHVHVSSSAGAGPRTAPASALAKAGDVNLAALPQFLFKVLLIGDGGVGKTSALSRYCDSAFELHTRPTLGVDFKVKNVRSRSGKTVKLQFWDTAGQERHRTLTAQYYRGAAGVVVVFDVTDAPSFARVEQWFAEADAAAGPGVGVAHGGSGSGGGVSKLVIGNKCDAADSDRRVDTKTAAAWCHARGLAYAETSALSGAGISDAFATLTEQMVTAVDASAALSASAAASSADAQVDDDAHAGVDGGAGAAAAASRSVQLSGQSIVVDDQRARSCAGIKCAA